MQSGHDVIGERVRLLVLLVRGEVVDVRAVGFDRRQVDLHCGNEVEQEKTGDEMRKTLKIVSINTVRMCTRQYMRFGRRGVTTTHALRRESVPEHEMYTHTAHGLLRIFPKTHISHQ